VALVGLRGAGKSHAGQRCSREDLGFPFVELSREIEKFAGCSVAEIQALYGPERLPPLRAPRAGGSDPDPPRGRDRHARRHGVGDPATFNLLLAHCTTVWLQAEPEDHMKRVSWPRATCAHGRQPARPWTT
jgi:XRE family aerobic/anaerobic benzoate catabolism transcriptional regulator